MTIETGSAQNTSRLAASPDALHARGKPGGAGNQGQGALGGFMAILASLGTSELAVAATEGNNGGLKSALSGGPAGLRTLVTDDDGTGALDSAAALDDPIGKLLQDVPTDAPATNLPTPTDVAAPVLPVVTELPPQTTALLAQSLQWSATPASNPELGKMDLAAGVPTGA